MSNRISEPRCTGVLLVAIAAIGWALNWPAVKLLLREWPPMFSRGVAGVVAALLLGGIATARGETLKVPRHMIARVLVASFTNVFAWMGFSTMALKYLRVSEGAVLVYTMPLWATMFAWLTPADRPTRRDIVALLIGFSGIVLLFSGKGFVLVPGKLIGVALALAAAMLFAVGSVMARRPIALAPFARVAWQVGAGCVPLVIFGWLLEQPDVGALTRVGWAALSYMAIVPMGICYLAWFAALNRLPAPTAAMGTLAVPIVASIAAAVQLGESLGRREFLAMALTLVGIALALAEKARRSSPALGQERAMYEICARHGLTPGDSDALEDRLYEYNAVQTGFRDAKGLGFIAEEGGDPIGAVAGYSWGGMCELRQVWVADAHRRRGLGRALVQAAVAEAAQRGCTHVFLATYDFQAPGFYARLGFREVARITDKPPGHLEFVMRRDLAAQPDHSIKPT